MLFWGRRITLLLLILGQFLCNTESFHITHLEVQMKRRLHNHQFEIVELLRRVTFTFAAIVERKDSSWWNLDSGKCSSWYLPDILPDNLPEERRYQLIVWRVLSKSPLRSKALLQSNEIQGNDNQGLIGRKSATYNYRDRSVLKSLATI